MDRKLVTVELGTPLFNVAETFGHDPDFTVTRFLLTRDMIPEVCRELYRKLLSCGDNPITLVLSGPACMMFVIGQLVGMNTFNLEIAQYTPEGYQQYPVASRNWLFANSVVDL